MKVTSYPLVFGIGSVIYTGIEIGVHWEYLLGCVNNIVVIRCENEQTENKVFTHSLICCVFRATLQMLFVFFQMYFIFQNQKVCMTRHC